MKDILVKIWHKSEPYRLALKDMLVLGIWYILLIEFMETVGMPRTPYNQFLVSGAVVLAVILGTAEHFEMQRKKVSYREYKPGLFVKIIRVVLALWCVFTYICMRMLLL